MAKKVKDVEEKVASEGQASMSWRGVLVAASIGLLCSIVFWIFGLYASYKLGTTDGITGGYLPVGAISFVLLLVLAVNPLLRWLLPRFVLSRRQLELILGIVLVACVVPGLIGSLPYALARVSHELNTHPQLGKIFEDMHLPAGLFPEKVGYGKSTSVTDGFYTELSEGKTIPWGAWLGPLVTWGAFLICCWMMMIGLSLIVLPRWVEGERLAFPLLTVQRSLLEEPRKGRLLADLFHKKSFWIPVAVVILLRFLKDIQEYHPGVVPYIDLRWDMKHLFTEDPLRYLPYCMQGGVVDFTLVGITFFMPTRAAFSIWFFRIAYAFHQMFVLAYTPTSYPWGAINDQRMGATIAIAVGVLWLGRQHWAHVMRCVVRRPATDADSRNRKSALMFLFGCIGMFAWLVWAGVPLIWAVVLVITAFIFCLVMARVVADTGLPDMSLALRYPLVFTGWVPVGWVTPVVLFFSTAIVMLFPAASGSNPTVLATHAIGLDQKASARQQWRLGLFLPVVLVLGLIICGASVLYMEYHNSTTVSGSTINPGGYGQLAVDQQMIQSATGQRNPAPRNLPTHFAFGALLAGFLQWACLVMPRWPLHPIGLLMLDGWLLNTAWWSILIGWSIKVVLVRLGGSRIYTASAPVFIGLIVGDVSGKMIWWIVKVIWPVTLAR